MVYYRSLLELFLLAGGHFKLSHWLSACALLYWICLILSVLCLRRDEEFDCTGS